MTISLLVIDGNLLCFQRCVTNCPTMFCSECPKLYQHTPTNVDQYRQNGKSHVQILIVHSYAHDMLWITQLPDGLTVSLAGHYKNHGIYTPRCNLEDPRI